MPVERQPKQALYLMPAAGRATSSSVRAAILLCLLACLLAPAGKDASEDFEEIGHSRAAKEMLAKYYIGEFAVRQAGVEARELGNCGGWLAAQAVQLRGCEFSTQTPRSGQL